jgi:hypothetical protein
MSIPMQRFQTWFMPSMACAAVSIALFNLGSSLERLKEFVWALSLVFIAAWIVMVVGWLILLYGFFFVFSIPSICWRFSREGRLYRELARVILEGRAWASQQYIQSELTDWAKMKPTEWANAVRQTLVQYYGDWSPEIEEFDLAGDRGINPRGRGGLGPHQVVGRQIGVLEQIQLNLYQPGRLVVRADL